MHDTWPVQYLWVTRRATLSELETMSIDEACDRYELAVEWDRVTGGSHP